MHIVRLASENIKRITAVEITPSGSLVAIGGKNGAGKSSVLDSIAYALGGEKLVPAEPIRAGEPEGKIVVDLGDVIVTRRFTRSKLPCTCRPAGSPTPSPRESETHEIGEGHTKTCASLVWDETKSTLLVTNKEGAKYPSPQAMLDKFLGRLTFDPLAFSREDAKTQNEILRRLVHLDFSLLNGQRQTAYDRRAMNKKTLTIAEGKLASLPTHPNVPKEELPIEELSATIRKGDELRRIAQTRIDSVETMQRIIEGLQRKRAAHAATITEIRVQIEKLQERLSAEDAAQASVDIEIEGKTREAEALVRVMEEAKAAVPNFEELDAKLAALDQTNRKVRENAAHAAQEAEVKRLAKLVAEEDAKIKKIDSQKADMLQGAKFPVAGLGLSEDGVTFGGLPLEQASASEQLRVSIAIGLALNPTLKVLLIRNGNLLDEENLKLVTEMAEDADAQVWMEFVTASPEGMTVLMEDGHVR